MADNISTTAGTFATDEIAGAHYERLKIVVGADGTNEGDVNSSLPLPVAVYQTFTTQPINGTVTANLSAADNTVLDNISTFTNSTNTILAQPLSSNTFRVTIAVDDVGIGGGTQYVQGNTTTLPTGSVMLWKSAVSTLVPVTSSLPLPVSSAPLTANLGTISSIATQATLAQITTYTKSTADMLGAALASTGALWVQSIPGAAQATISTTDLIRVAVYNATDGQVTNFGSGTQYVDGNTSTLPTGTVMLWKSAVSTLVPVTTSLPLPVSSAPLTANLGTISSIATQATLAEVTTYTASSVSLLSTLALTNSTRLSNVTTFTNSTNTLLVQVSSMLAPKPTGIYVQPVGVSSNGLTPYLTLDANNSTKQVVSTAATIYGIYFGNTSTTPAYLKIWDGVSSATFVSSTAATMCIPVPANSTNIVGGNFNAGNGIGIKMSTGICLAAVAGPNNGNSTAIGTSSLIVNLLYSA